MDEERLIALESLRELRVRCPPCMMAEGAVANHHVVCSPLYDECPKGRKYVRLADGKTIDEDEAARHRVAYGGF